MMNVYFVHTSHSYSGGGIVITAESEKQAIEYAQMLYDDNEDSCYDTPFRSFTASDGTTYPRVTKLKGVITDSIVPTILAEDIYQE